ncbi:GntR family transcriptional regulator [Alicyclobacillus macrosporangiidus]|uniref:GntR family transcriptional regulator n=1 Tax=Alicyclobacillus macrosporangiidus TaxID=392015 RepID=A0A1I7L3P7_9BACL|nr:GntR family transcriptional regulator [Alicyclobacillus macrosporangiidus]SFV04255.1 GntR family transcriptional regulator [Alicyclobacillus macrosporangiidus]
MWLRVNPRLPVPVYQQVVDGVKAAVAKGMLVPGDRLPSVRELAVELAINHNTVAKAYQELERARVIEVIRGRGTFIAEPAIPSDEARRRAALREAMKKLLVEAHHLHLQPGEALALFADVVREWEEEQGQRNVDRGEDSHGVDRGDD